MNERLDPIDALARLNPVPDDTRLAPTAVHEPAQRLLRHLLDNVPSETSPRARPRSWRRGVIAGMAVAAMVSVTAAGAWIIHRRAGNPTEIACYAGPSLDADATITTGGGRDPVAACTAIWQTGAFRDRGPVPPLAGCVLSSGVAGVFPTQNGPGLCDALGLAPLQQARPGATDGVSVAVEVLTSALGHDCVDIDRAAQLARVALDDAGLTSWQVDVASSTSADWPCASVAVDAPAKTIRLVPIPVPPPTGQESPPMTKLSRAAIATALVAAVLGFATDAGAGPGTGPGHAFFDGREIDLARGWDGATACTTDGTAVTCFATEAELNAHLASTVHASSTCWSSLHLYEDGLYTGRTLDISVEGPWINLSGYGFSNITSSFTVGACASYLADGSDGGGDWYPGGAAYSAVGVMAGGWNDRIGSVYVT